MAEKMGVGDYVPFTGRASNEDLFPVLSNHVCVNTNRLNPMNAPSRMNKTLEYMTIEKPIGQFDIKESHFSAGKALLYAKANDAHKMIDLIGDLEQHAQLRQFGRGRFECEILWYYQIERLISAYRRALGR
jgi:hypothetical protein